MSDLSEGTGEGSAGRDRPVALVTAACRGPGLDALRQLCDVTYDPWIDQRPLRIWDGAALAERVDALGATVLVCEADFVSGPVLDRPLRVIGSTRGDPTNVDIAAATARGIPVLHTPGRNADGVAELTLALLLAVTRRLLPADRDVRAGQVFRDGSIPYQRFRAWQIAGRTAGLVGLGAVGGAVRWRLEALGMRVNSFDPYSPEATHDSLDKLLADADVVSMHAAVTAETMGMMGADQFAAMPAGSVYLNTARAGLHDLDALTEALRSGHLGGAGLDHFAGEQLPVDHPVTGLDNVVLTPHIGGATYDTEVNHTATIAEDIGRVLRGERPRHCANPEVFA
ncbi:MAG TPA: NAD(P)-dependent oxidoreductase [Acidimicrobiales bacterium]|jgi:D-3-phosphoglycerate dehydrogenase|nr:NAD(P)-dependent oxidoreductase [Acidimicrobiales bacterium]